MTQKLLGIQKRREFPEKHPFHKNQKHRDIDLFDKHVLSST